MTEDPQNTQYFEKTEDVALSSEQVAEIKQVTNIMKNFSNAEKIFRLFPPSNVNVREAVGHFTTSLSIFFNKFQKPLVLQVTQTRFLYLNQPVYENVEKDKSLSFRIYIDGVRGISFAPGCEEMEAKELMNVYLELSLIDPLENDFVSLFWEKDFRFLSIASTDVFAEETEDSANEFSFERDFSNIIEGAQNLGRMFNDAMNHSQQVEGRKAGERSEEEKEILRLKVDVFKLSEEEKQTLQQYCQEEEKYESVFDFIEIVFTLFGLNQDPQIFPDIVSVIGKTIDGFIARYRFDHAGALLRRVREYALGDETGLDDNQKNIVRQMIHSLANEAFFEKMEHHLKNSTDADAKSVFNLLSDLDPGILPDIFDLIKNERFVEEVKKLFVKLGKDQFDFFKNRIAEFGPQEASHILDILAEIDIEQALPIFIEKMNDPDPKVRSKVVNIMMKYDFDELKQVFLKAVQDTNKSMQMTALRYYNKHTYEDVFPLLSDMFQKKDFLDESRDIQQLVIGAMVKANMERSFELISGVLRKKPLIGGKKIVKFQKDVIRTLSGLTSIEVAELLLKLIDEGKMPPDMMEQCRMAVGTIRTRIITNG